MLHTHNQRMNPVLIDRRHLLSLAAGLGLPALAQTNDPVNEAAKEAAWAALKAPTSIVLFRHALAPGGGDPPGFKLDDCSTQRNLSPEGETQAKRIGQVFIERGIKVQAVWHSAWCRTRDTAQLAFANLRESAFRVEPAFNSFFSDRSTSSVQTAAARKLLLAWSGPGTLVIVTHQVNITALTDIVPQSGEGVVLQRQAGKLVVKGRVLP
jgi:phosphohistidine phosphatase SixA